MKKCHMTLKKAFMLSNKLNRSNSHVIWRKSTFFKLFAGGYLIMNVHAVLLARVEVNKVVSSIVENPTRPSNVNLICSSLHLNRRNKLTLNWGGPFFLSSKVTFCVLLKWKVIMEKLISLPRHHVQWKMFSWRFFPLKTWTLNGKYFQRLVEPSSQWNK